MNVKNVVNFSSITILSKYSYKKFMSMKNLETIYIKNLIKCFFLKKKTVFFNYKKIFGNSKLIPKIQINADTSLNICKANLNNNLNLSTKSQMNDIFNKTSILYGSVYNNNDYKDIIKKNIIFNELYITKEFYKWESDKNIKNIKKVYFSENTFVICISSDLKINSYPKSLIQAIKILRKQGCNINLLILGKVKVDYKGLTENLYNEIKSYDWIKFIDTIRENYLTYYRLSDLLASTGRDYHNHIDMNLSIKEYLLVDKPILCSRGRERELELGKYYDGFYTCETCDSVPPIFWTKEYQHNKSKYIELYDKYFRKIDESGGNKNEIESIKNILELKIKSRNCREMEFISKNLTLKNNSDLDNYFTLFNKMSCENYKSNLNFELNDSIKNIKIVCVMCAYKREKLLDEVLNYLSSLNLIHKIIIVGSNGSEKIIVDKYSICEFHMYDNLPLSNKWNKVVKESKKHNPDGILILGSDDIVSSDYFLYSKYLLSLGYDIIGTRSWFTMLKKKNQIIDYALMGYTNKRKNNESLGAGRVISKKALDLINWNLYNFNTPLNKSLDRNSFLKLLNIQDKIKFININITSTIFVLSLKDIIYEDISVTHSRNIKKKEGSSWYIWQEKSKNKNRLCYTDFFFKNFKNIDYIQIFDYINKVLKFSNLKISQESKHDKVDEKPTFINAIKNKKNSNTKLHNNHILAYTKKNSFTLDENIDLYIHNYHKTKIDINIIEFFTKKIVYIDSCSSEVQPNYELNFAEGCKWYKNKTIKLKNNLDPGLYIIKLYTKNNDFYIPIIIINKEKFKDILVIMNTNTWCAYNYYGEGSFYKCGKIENKYARKIGKKNIYNSEVSSFNKPNERISNEIRILLNNIQQNNIRTSHLFHGESYLWLWLKKHNYEFDIISDIDIENKEFLKNRKIIFLNCHPEYWSHKMYYNFVECFQKTYTNLIYLGGNAIWRKVYFNKELNRIEKLGYPFINKILNKFHSKYSIDEFAKFNLISFEPYLLLGMYYDATGYNTYQYFKCINKNSWIFDKTGIKKDELLGTFYDCLKPSGHETDKINHKYLNKNKIKNLPQLLAKGLNPDKSKNNGLNNLGGGDICLHKFFNAKVFSCGSITFTQCLVDPKITIILKNVINKFII